MAVTQSLSVTEVSGSVNNTANTSKIRILWQSTQSGDSWNGYTKTAKYYVSINGGAETEYTVSYTLPQNATKTIVDTTLTITHLSDGTGSVKVRTWMNTHISAGVVENSKTLNLTTIPRASTIYAVSNRYLGEYCAVRWIPLSKTFRYKLKFSMAGWEHTTDAIHPNQTSSFLYTGYLIPLDVATKIPNSLTGTMTVTLYTYLDSNASVQVGSAASEQFTVTVPDNEKTKPYATEMILTPISSLEGEFAKMYVQGLSKVKVTSSEKGQYGATIVSKSITVEDKSYGGDSDYTTDYLSGYGTVYVKLTLTDSRGIVNTGTYPISVIPYSKPRVIPRTGETSIVCARCDVNGNFTDAGTYLRIRARRSFSLCMINGEQKNFCGLRFRYKAASGGAFSSWQNLLLANSTTEEVDIILLGGALLTTSSYVVQIDAVDSIPNDTYVTFDIPTEDVFMHKAASIGSLGIGEYVEEADIVSIAKKKAVRLKSNINGLRMHTKIVSGTAELNINTKYADFTGTGNERQTFFVFGEANGTMVYGVARASNNGTTLWSGTSGVTLNTKSGGILTVVLPKVAYDNFTIISSGDFEI